MSKTLSNNLPEGALWGDIMLDEERKTRTTAVVAVGAGESQPVKGRWRVGQRTEATPVAEVQPSPAVEKVTEQQQDVSSYFNEDNEIAKLSLNILAVRQSVKNVEEELAQEDEENDSKNELVEDWVEMSERLDYMYWQFGQLVGHDTLWYQRWFWGTIAHSCDKIQEKHYKLQKERYEDCRHGKKFFTKADRAFIEHHKALNSTYLEYRELAMDNRELFADIMENAFPDSEFDSGFGEGFDDTFWNRLVL